MYLGLNDLVSLFPEKQGIQDDIFFHTFTDQAMAAQPRGVFVSINEESGELSEAIANGAVAAIWNHEKRIPRYTPNHFPIFFANDLTEAIRIILKFYIEKLDGETDNNMEITNFKFSNKELLNKNKQTYDIAVMLKRLTNKSANTNEGRE